MVTNRDRAPDSSPQNGSSKVVHFFSFFILHTYIWQLGCPRNKKTKNTVRTVTNRNPQDLFRLCFGLFHETNNNKFLFVSAFFGVSNLYRNNRNKQNSFKTNRNNPKFSEKYQNMLSIKLFLLVFCLFRFNRNIETLFFGIEAKQTVSKQTKTNRKNWENLKFSEKILKFAPYQTVSVSLLFVSVQSKHRNSLFRNRRETTETNILF